MHQFSSVINRNMKSTRRSNPLSVPQKPVWMIKTRQLDLVLLAGCSCLLTLMFQPIASAMSSQNLPEPSLMAYPTQLNGLSCIVAYHVKQVQTQPQIQLQD